MSFENLTLVYNNMPFPKKKQLYKIYNDGGHYIATKFEQASFLQKHYRNKYGQIVCDLDLYNKAKVYRKSSVKYAIDILFDNLYLNSARIGYKRAETVEYIRNGILKLFPERQNVNEFIERKIKRAKHNLSVRRKRFKRKADLNEWNYFVTFTYDDKLHTEETFKKQLRKCLCNLHTRRGWRYMGVWEKGDETDRLHFHGLFYIPDFEMVGDLATKKDYSTKEHKMRTYVENDFFKLAFGRNEFDELSNEQLKYGRTKDYILKYIGKTGERIVYSRGISTEIYKELTDEDIITEYEDFGTRYVLFDNAVDYVKDVLKLRHYKQMTIFTNVCNSRLTM